ncbi:MAG: glycosyltransferase [Alphaproteobacteria bacterium]|nr:glycosyltransferase [Alphaproteobacteria bacterium]
MSDLRLLHIIAGAAHGGAETFCLDAICALHDAGAKQFVICRPHDNYIKALEARGIPYKTMSFSRLNRFLRGSAMIRETVAAFKPDVVHAWMGRASSFVPKGLGVPVLGWFGGYYDLKRFQACDYYMGVTRDIVRHIDAQSGKPEKSFVVHTFGTLEKDAKPADRASLETPDDARIVLLLSRMHQKKGVDTLLNAAKTMPEDVYFWLAGDGPEIDDYKALCTQLGLDGRVRFLGWRDDRSALLQAADVCTLPSRYEPFGTVMAEAWFAGVPLVAAKAAGPKAYVEHGVNGLLCEIDDVEGLRTCLMDSLDDAALRETLIANGHLTCETLFSRDGTVKALYDAYETMRQGGKNAARAA